MTKTWNTFIENENMKQQQRPLAINDENIRNSGVSKHGTLDKTVEQQIPIVSGRDEKENFDMTHSEQEFVTDKRPNTPKAS